MKVLNIGGGPKSIPIPPFYNGWTIVRVDINPAMEPDLEMDVRDLDILPAADYDAVYGSHILEHFAPHELDEVLAGILHVLKADGFVEIRVPDVMRAIQAIYAHGGDLHAPMYLSKAGLITARDMLWGYGPYLQANIHQAHHNGFTEKELHKVLHEAGFKAVYVGKTSGYELRAIASRGPLDDDRLAALGVVV